MDIEIDCDECDETGQNMPDCESCNGKGWTEDPCGGTMTCTECNDRPCFYCGGKG